MNVYEDTCAVTKECIHCCVANSYGYECSCPTGFSLGQDNKTCEGNPGPNSSQESTSSSTTVKRRPQLFAPANGSSKRCSNLPGQTCIFSCDRGFKVAGSVTGKCSSNGTWNGTQTHCNAVTCPALEAPFNGMRLSCSGKTIEYYNTVCLFSCGTGFNEFGCPSRKCLENGTWSGKDFLCTAVTCSQLETPLGASLKERPSCNNAYGSKCVFTCKDGFVMSRKKGEARNVTRSCLQSGQWSGNHIKCKGG